MCCVLAAILPLACQPLRNATASAIVVSPNRGNPVPTKRDGEHTVSVGPPSATLSLEIIDCKNPRGTVFVLHGIRADRTSLRSWGEMLAAASFRAILVDLRGHGRSTGDGLSYGVIESRDLAQALDALLAGGLHVGSVGVMGFSYGAATGIQWAAIDARIRAVVAVASFSSLRAIVQGYAPVPLTTDFVNGAVDLAGKQGGFDPDAASPVVAIARTRAAVLLIHGTEDRQVPAWHSELIFAARPDRTELVLVPDAAHDSIVDDAVIDERVPSWLAAHLARE